MEGVQPEPGVDTGQCGPIEILGGTGVFDRCSGTDGQLFVVKSENVAARLVLVDQVDIEEQRVVGVDGARHTEVHKAT